MTTEYHSSEHLQMGNSRRSPKKQTYCLQQQAVIRTVSYKVVFRTNILSN